MSDTYSTTMTIRCTDNGPVEGLQECRKKGCDSCDRCPHMPPGSDCNKRDFHKGRRKSGGRGKRPRMEPGAAAAQRALPQRAAAAAAAPGIAQAAKDATPELLLRRTDPSRFSVLHTPLSHEDATRSDMRSAFGFPATWASTIEVRAVGERRGCIWWPKVGHSVSHLTAFLLVHNGLGETELAQADLNLQGQTKAPCVVSYRAPARWLLG